VSLSELCISIRRRRNGKRTYSRGKIIDRKTNDRLWRYNEVKGSTAYWAAVEERTEGGQRIQVIEGTMTVGTDRFGPENRHQINGTLTPYGEHRLLAIQGSNNNN
jgi:hypothetical protein